jgi:hypothetical protein
MEESKSTSPSERNTRRSSSRIFGLRPPRKAVSSHPAISECLNRVQSGGNDPWDSYLGHRSLSAFNMQLISDPLRSKFWSEIPVSNSALGDWLRSPDENSEDIAASLKLLIVAAEGSQTTLQESRSENRETMKMVFSEWKLPPVAVSLLYTKRTLHLVEYLNTEGSKTPRKLHYIEMREWVFIWFTSDTVGHPQSCGILFYLDKTWAESVPESLLYYIKTLCMFSDSPKFLGLATAMTALQCAADALAKDNREAFDREYELRGCLKSNQKTSAAVNLGLLFAQVSWLSARVSRHRDRLAVVENIMGHEKWEDDHQELGPCFANLTQTRNALDSQAQQLLNQAEVQLSTVSNLRAQRDQAAAHSIAKASHRIAAASRADQKVGVDIARSSRAIAINSLRDSSSMKAIAHVTMVFLPGTFVASLFAMPFFGPSHQLGFSVHPRVWIYAAVTVPLTVLTLACAGIWYHYNERSQSARLSRGDAPNENLIDQSSFKEDVEKEVYPWDNDEDWGSIDRQFAPSPTQSLADAPIHHHLPLPQTIVDGLEEIKMIPTKPKESNKEEGVARIRRKHSM